jgi:hypothetical protein
MRPFGEIVLLQVQIASLKVGETPWRRYDPAALRQVPGLELTAEGVSGLSGDGARLPDVHNQNHPASKNRGGTNGISLGFTAHYDHMRARFGAHLGDGIAGENILVRLDRPDPRVQADDLRGDLVIATAGGAVRLRDLFVAAPCVEFARYALRFPDDCRPDRSVTEAVQFLDAGTRGFYARYAGEPAVVRVGDRVCLA